MTSLWILEEREAVWDSFRETKLIKKRMMDKELIITYFSIKEPLKIKKSQELEESFSIL